MASKRISSTDAAWLLLESPDTPMHVGGLLEFTPPPGAELDFPGQWRERMRKRFTIPQPWNLVPVRPKLPYMRETQDIDLDHHVRLWGLPQPGGQRELGVLVSRLHSQPLDMRRPLWEVHVIEGLADGRFAGYVKLHHSLVDGVSAMRLLGQALTNDPDARNMDPLWTVGPRQSGRAPVDAVARGARKAVTVARRSARAAGGLGRAAAELRRGMVDDLPLQSPFGVPRSVLADRITGQRRFATQQYDLNLLKRLAKAADASLNDIVLYLCGTALRGYLAKYAELPDRPLTAGVPVSLREEGDDRVGTAIGFLVADLGTNVADPRERLEVIKRSTEAAKRHLRKMPPESLATQAVVINGPYIAGLLAGLGKHAPIPFGLAVSNVPGPREPLYLDGARLDGMYPVSLLTHGNALNITCVSYVDTMNFGFVGARDSLPHLQRLATGMGETVREAAHLF